MKKQLAWIFGGGSVVASAVLAASLMGGCSNNNGDKDAGNDATTPDAGNDVVTNPDTGTDTGGGDTGPTCKSNPSLHPSGAGTIFCGYLPEGGPGFDCDAGQQCCLGGSLGGGLYAPEQCATFGGACDNPATDKGLHIECQQTSDCAANGKTGNVCCLQGASGAPAVEANGCPAADLKLSGGSGIRCEQGSCTQSGDLQICESQAECADAGKTCTAFRWKVYQIGYCM